MPTPYDARTKNHLLLLPPADYTNGNMDLEKHLYSPNFLPPGNKGSGVSPFVNTLNPTELDNPQRPTIKGNSSELSAATGPVKGNGPGQPHDTKSVQKKSVPRPPKAKKAMDALYNLKCVASAQARSYIGQVISLVNKSEPPQPGTAAHEGDTSCRGLKTSPSGKTDRTEKKVVRFSKNVEMIGYSELDESPTPRTG